MKTIKFYLLILLLNIPFFLIFSQSISIPFYLNSRNNIIIEYAIKGEKLKFLFDTGTNGNYIDIGVSDRLNFLSHPNNKKIPMTTIGNNQFEAVLVESPYKADSVFNSDWLLTDMDKTREILNLDKDVSGIMGVDFKNNSFLLEIDFRNSRINFWNKLPEYYFNNKQVQKTELINADFNRENKTSGVLANHNCIKGDLYVADSLHLQPYFTIDTGFDDYLILAVYDSALLNEMVSYKKTIIQKYGANYPTIQLKIDDLMIDTSLISTPVINKSSIDYNDINVFGNYKLGGLLGLKFLLRYEKILFDRKNNFIYFMKK